jgi:anti-anti-sigma factor
MEVDIMNMEGRLAVVSIKGEMDLYCASQVKARILNHWNSRRDSLILNLADLIYLDSSGIGTIIKVYSEARNRGLGFYLAAVPPPIYRVMELTKLIGFLPICQTVPEAVGILHFNFRDPVSDEKEAGPLMVNSRHPLFNLEGMKYKDFNLDFGRIRYLSHLLSQQAPADIREFNLLEQQISEIVKNAIRHGNQNDIRKKVKIWYSFSSHNARLIVEDEGKGFARLEEWNAFFHKRMECFTRNDFEGMTEYVSYRTEDSVEDDGGNAMFAAVEYWNDGVVYNEARNAVAVGRSFDRR